MASASTVDLLGSLRKFGLLESAQLDELTRKLAGKNLDPRTLCKRLIEQGWLTPYQINQLLQGRGQELVLGQYVIRERLGEGGNGQVFKARHRAMQRDVAVKVLRRELLTDAEVVGRFHREIEVVSQISHVNIVHAYDAGPIGSSLVLAMEFIEGSDLDRLVRQAGPLSVPEAVDFIRQAAIGLQHAHERGLVHRDIKPANLLVTQPKSVPISQRSTVRMSVTLDDQGAANLPYGLIKILDLGLARLQEAAPDSRSANLTLVSGPSVMQGTPDYMAPEQALDFHAADIRADIYSLGCTLFFLLTGRPPFAGASLAQKLLKHQQAEPPAVEKIRADIPPALVGVLGKMLAKQPADRFQTPGDVARALTGLLASDSAPRRRRGAGILAGPRLAWRAIRQRRRLGLAVAGVLLAALALALMPLARQKPDALESSDRAALTWLLELLDRPDVGEAEAVHRLGKFTRLYPHMQGPLRDELLAVQMRRPGSWQAYQAGIWLTYLPSPLDQLSSQQIPEKKRFAGQPAELVAVLGDQGPTYYRVVALAFRPDCKMLAFSIGPPEVALWDFGKGTPQKLPDLRGHGSLVSALAFSLDSKWLASGGGNNQPSGDNAVRLWDVTKPDIKAEAVLTGHTNTVNTLAVSPDGRWLASSGQDQTVRVWDLGSREGRLLAEKTTFVNSLAFAPDGKTLAIAGSYWPLVRLLEFTPAAGKQADLKYATQQHTQKVAYAPDGQTLASVADGQVVLWDPSKQVERARLKAQGLGARDVVFLPDGKTLLSGEAGDESQTNVNEPEGPVVVWSMQAREPVRTWKLPCGGVKKLALASDGRHLAVGGRNSVVYILRLGPPKIGP